ncbi:MAG: putative bifunctional diguanylate cyclase/phosphodiesterase [Pseudomonadota bacterium]
MSEHSAKRNPTSSLLVVDDDRVTRMTLQRVLRKAGYEVVEAANGEEALERFGEVRPDLILMDVLMPVMDGFEACRAIRQGADHQQVPILMLTGLNDVDSIDRAFDSGATDFITKPINWTLLLQRVRYSLRMRDMAMALQRNQDRLSRAQQIAGLGYWELELESGAVHCSEEFYHVLGLSPTVKIEQLENFIQRVPRSDRQRVRETLATALSGPSSYELEHRLLRADGSLITVHQQGEPTCDDKGRATSILGTLQDITDRKKAEALIEYQAFYDGLTDLPNRRLFTDHVEHALELGRGSDLLTGVIFLGLDRFKIINDSLGHGAGDELLRGVAKRLKRLSGDGLGAARFGADVFGLLMEGVEQFSQLDHTLQRLQEAITKPFVLQGQEFFITASMGVAVAPHDCSDAECLLKAADTAMYRAKETGGGYQYFTQDMNGRAHQRLNLEAELRKAVEQGQFELFYQPQVDGDSRRILSMEALLRWRHPERGLVSPGEFIPVAEESGLIVPMGEWVLQEACRQTAHWNAKHGLALRVGVNLSARQFAHTELMQSVVAALDESALPPEMLDLEVTESIAMQDVQACIQILREFHAMGVKSSMDDFGTGYSSLSYLQQLPLHTLKIDRAFVKDINAAGENGEIARAVIAMAHSLNMEVVAEGVETEEQLGFLRAQGCDVMQGFLFSPPVDITAFEKLLLECDTR